MTITEGTIAHGPAGTGHVDIETKHKQWRMAGMLFLVSDIVFVVALFFSYLYLRELNVANMWRPSSVHPPALIQNVLLAGVVVASAVFWRVGLKGARADRQGQMRFGIFLAVALFAVDLAVQMWQFSTVTFPPSAGGYAGSFYVLAGYHVFHLVFGGLLGLGVLARSLRGRYGKDAFTEIQIVGYLWNWVAIMAVGMVFLPK